MEEWLDDLISKQDSIAAAISANTPTHHGGNAESPRNTLVGSLSPPGDDAFDHLFASSTKPTVTDQPLLRFDVSSDDKPVDTVLQTNACSVAEVNTEMPTMSRGGTFYYSESQPVANAKPMPHTTKSLVSTTISATYQTSMHSHVASGLPSLPASTTLVSTAKWPSTAACREQPTRTASISVLPMVDLEPAKPVCLPANQLAAETTFANAESQANVGPSERGFSWSKPTDPPKVTIHNIMSALNTRCHLNLKKIAMEGMNVIYKHDMGLVHMRLRKPLCSAQIRSSGKIVLVGTLSGQESRVAARRVCRYLQKIGFAVKFANFRLLNVLGTAKFPFRIDIGAFTAANRKFASYEPELHPAATYRLKDEKAVVKLFTTGSLTVTAPSEEAAQRAVNFITPLVFCHRVPPRKRSHTEATPAPSRHHADCHSSHTAPVDGSSSAPSKKRPRRAKRKSINYRDLDQSDEEEDSDIDYEQLERDQWEERDFEGEDSEEFDSDDYDTDDAV